MAVWAAAMWAGEDGDAAIQRMLTAQKANGQRILPYTYIEESTHYSYTGDGKLKKDYSETRDVIFLEGLPFPKLVARNGRPLPKKEQAQVAKLMSLTAAERRRKLQRTPPGGQLAMGDQTIDLGSNAELLMFYENRLVGEEEVRGRRAWVVECEPRRDYAPASEHEREMMSFRRKLWIDEAENVPLREVFTVAGDGIHFARPGSTIEVDYEKIGTDVWFQTGMALEIWRTSGRGLRPWKRTEYVNREFRKFDVESTVTVVR